MASERITIYAGEPVTRVLEGWDDERSGRINAICARYTALMFEARPAFTVDEWCFLFDTLNGSLLDGSRFGPSLLLEVQDALRLGQGAQWKIDPETFPAKIAALPLVAKASIAECAERFWRTDALEGETYAEMFTRLGFPLA